MMRGLRYLLAAGLLLMATDAAMAQERARVVAVNYPLQYLAERLLGDAAEVVFPVPKDVDPSFWRPSIADISMIQSADLILLNGAGFSSWVDRVSLPRAKLVNTSAAIEEQFITTQSITHSHGAGGEHSHEGVASYVWLDRTLAMSQAKVIAMAITDRGLAPAEEVAARLAALLSELVALDEQTQAALQPLRDVAFIATHPRYQYFARRYGLSIASLEWDAGAIPDETQMAELALFAESTQPRILIWEAEPSAAAFERTQDLGLVNIVFAPLAHGTSEADFIAAFTQAISAIASTDVE